MNFPVSSCYVVQNTASHNYYKQSGAKFGAEAKVQTCKSS